MLKPFRHKELAIQVELAYYNYPATQANSVDPFLSDSLYLPVEQGRGYVRIKKGDVQYLAADRVYVEIYLVDELQKRVFTMNLGYLAQFFTTTNFYSLSRSLLVNLDYVERIDKGQFMWQAEKRRYRFRKTIINCSFSSSPSSKHHLVGKVHPDGSPF
ncbi:hypothetical protein GCM10027592_30580 [Spirosoma flavus]